MSKETIDARTWAPVARVFEAEGWSVSIGQKPNNYVNVCFHNADEPQPLNRALNIVTINGLDADHTYRPNYAAFFNKEGWSRFDIGILPGPRWSSGYSVALPNLDGCPRLGISEAGWPASDRAFSYGQNAINPATFHVLYAPQYEIDGKQKHLTDALSEVQMRLGVAVRLTVKHWVEPASVLTHGNAVGFNYMRNMERMNTYSQSKLDTRILPSRSNIYDALAGVHLLVTDQSSVIYDAVVRRVASLSVYDWKHACQPDCRGLQPSPDVTFACLSSNLVDVLESIWSNQLMHKQTANRLDAQADNNFANRGVAAQAFYSVTTAALQGRPLPFEIAVDGGAASETARKQSGPKVTVNKDIETTGRRRITLNTRLRRLTRRPHYWLLRVMFDLPRFTWSSFFGRGSESR